MSKEKQFKSLEAPEIIAALRELYQAAEKFISLTGMEYTEDEEYVLHNVEGEDHDFEWHDMLESISCVDGDVEYLLNLHDKCKNDPDEEIDK